MPAFLGILGIQGVCLLLIPHAANKALFAVLAALVYLCYGGAFGTMPSTAGAFFGVSNVGAIYGLMLIGWSIGGVVGPLLIASLIGSEKAYTLGFTVIGVITLVALLLPLVTRKPRRDDLAAMRPHTGAVGRGQPGHCPPLRCVTRARRPAALTWAVLPQAMTPPRR